jgi:hypothetical protein
MEKVNWPEWALSTHSPVKDAVLHVGCRLNVGNLRNTGHSTEAAPPAALAELLPQQ